MASPETEKKIINMELIHQHSVWKSAIKVSFYYITFIIEFKFPQKVWFSGGFFRCDFLGEFLGMIFFGFFRYDFLGNFLGMDFREFF